MIKVGLISDTHGVLDEQIFTYFEKCDEIWHAGDFGSLDLADELAAFKPLIGVYGNIDGKEVRSQYPLDMNFTREGFQIWMTHIGGYPGRYERRVWEKLQVNPPQIFVCGHSHILKVIRDKHFQNMMTINPGAAGHHGFHKVRTAIRFTLDIQKIRDFEVIELGRRGTIS